MTGYADTINEILGISHFTLHILILRNLIRVQKKPNQKLRKAPKNFNLKWSDPV